MELKMASFNRVAFCKTVGDETTLELEGGPLGGNWGAYVDGGPRLGLLCARLPDEVELDVELGDFVDSLVVRSTVRLLGRGLVGTPLFESVNVRVKCWSSSIFQAVMIIVAKICASGPNFFPPFFEVLNKKSRSGERTTSTAAS